MDAAHFRAMEMGLPFFVPQAAKTRDVGQLQEYIAAAAGVGALTIGCWLLTSVTGYAAISLIYLLGVLLAGMLLNRGPVLLVAALSALSWNFLFIPPLFTFHIHKVQDALMFLTYFVVAITIGSLTSRLRAREQIEREREHRATALYQFAQMLAAAPTLESAFSATAVHIKDLLNADASILLEPPSNGGELLSYPPTGTYLPIKRLDVSFGVLRLEAAQDLALGSAELQLLQAFADQLANLIERDRLLQVAAKAQLSGEAERLRKALLDCVSHELKTPIAAIGAASHELLRITPGGSNQELSRQLAHEIQHGSRRLNRIVNNLLDMTRLESGVVRPKVEWCDVRELLQSAIQAEEEAISDREIRLAVPEEFPLALIDYSLIEQAVAKLLGNAGSYTSAEEPIEVEARCTENQMMISVSDRGPGLPIGAPEKVFEKFYRADGSKTGGLGLGLSIVRGFVEAHGGRLTAENREGGGARFTITVPVRMTDHRSLESIS